MTQEIEICEQRFTLHPSGSLFWGEKSILMISDVHLGKISHFRKFGAAVPQQAINANFNMMDAVSAYFNPERIIFLGDLFHSHLNREWRHFEDWTSRTTAKIILINGNHDVISDSKYEALGIEVFDEHIIDDFLLTHHPEIRERFFNFCGHVHPSVKISGIGKQTLRLPCFFKKRDQMILPAFGEFTGTYTLKPQKKDEIFALADGVVIKI